MSRHEDTNIGNGGYFDTHEDKEIARLTKQLSEARAEIERLKSEITFYSISLEDSQKSFDKARKIAKESLDNNNNAVQVMASLEARVSVLTKALEEVRSFSWAGVTKIHEIVDAALSATTGKQ